MSGETTLVREQGLTMSETSGVSDAAAAAAEAALRGTPSDFVLLSQAFHAFTQRTQKLQEAYQRLREQVQSVNAQLEEKNRALKSKIVELDTTREYLDNVLESIPSGVVAVNLRGEITTFNAAAEQICGTRREEVIGRAYAEVFIAGRGPRPAILTTLKTQRATVNHDGRLWVRDGRAVPVTESTSVVRNVQGEVTGAIQIFTDLSEQRLLEEQVQRADRLAALGQMAATVAHEIRNPLGGIEGFAALLERDLQNDPPRQEMARNIVEGARALNRIVGGLLDFTRPVQIEIRRVGLSQIIDHAVGFVEKERGPSWARTRIVRQYDPDDEIEADALQLEQVVLNLVLNALQAMPEGGELRVSTRARRDHVEIDICDTGYGIPTDVQRRLFTPFFTTKENGHGLGLSTAHKIVLAHRGRISVRTEERRGTVFTVTIPRHRRNGVGRNEEAGVSVGEESNRIGRQRKRSTQSNA